MSKSPIQPSSDIEKDWDVFSGASEVEVIGAREHNLKNISVKIPRNQLVVITGLSGSGKSSLAFDTIFAEGQRRYIESFSTYARQFLGNMKKPDVDQINGLSPVIAIEQKTTSKSPRSTVGTVTEIYDFLRLLYARTAEAFSYKTGEKMVAYTLNEIEELISVKFSSKKILCLAPLVKGRKGHYRELFERYGKLGYSKVRCNGEILDIVPGMKLDRYKIHDIELVIDRLKVEEKAQNRIRESIENCLDIGKGEMVILEQESQKAYFYSQQLTCPTSGISYPPPEPNLFSFNSPYGACPKCKGLGVRYEFDEEKVLPNKKLSIKKGGILPLGKHKKNYVFQRIEELCETNDIDINTPIEKLPDGFIQTLLAGDEDQDFDGILSYLEQLQEFKGIESRWIRNYMLEKPCSSCEGKRLNQTALHFKIAGKNISEVCLMDMDELSNWLSEAPNSIKSNKIIAEEILKEAKQKVEFLREVGLNYLSLHRTAKTLSGGESQRIRLATQIGSQLVGVLYILDEPSIGLHQSDNIKLIQSLQKLKDNGNSVFVVEHDQEIMEKSDFIIDIGPGAGSNGGKIIDYGKLEELSNQESTTFQYLKGIKKIQVPKSRRKGNGKTLQLKGAEGNNLKSVNLNIPLGTFTCISGISGSGKSSLINGTLVPLLYSHVYQSKVPPLTFKEIKGLEHIDKVIEIDQSPIGRTPRSNPATYTGVFSDIRNFFAQLPQSKISGFKPGRFSFNVSGGRCEDCKGAGVNTIEMNFLPDVYVTCKTCNGKRYNSETLRVRYKGKSISDVLEMSIKDAVEFFESHPKIARKIQALSDVGLGYVKIGQPSTTLSGGEAQRIKLASELSKKDTGNTIFILDEPTTGLHFEDIDVLLGVLQKIVDRGNTVLVIEHNLDVLKCADYLIDLGPKGGKEGGKIMAEGTPEKVAKTKNSPTGTYLKDLLYNKK
jgi:excinuclease ABC subunit A